MEIKTYAGIPNKYVSENMEFYDVVTDFQVYKAGLYLADAIYNKTNHLINKTNYKPKFKTNNDD